MDRQGLFVETVSELRGLTASPTEYGTLRIAALLRLLLLDSPRLIDEVNRDRRFKVVFRVLSKDDYVQMVLDDGAVFYSTEDGLDPDTGAFGSVAELNRDQFLKQRVMVVNGHSVSVHDLIDQLAHIEGGVHIGMPRSEKEQALADAAKAFGIGGLPAGIRMMAAIGRVVIRALEDLERSILTV